MNFFSKIRARNLRTDIDKDEVTHLTTFMTIIYITFCLIFPEEKEAN